MHLLFIDESGTPPKPGKEDYEYFVMGGLAIPDEKWIELRGKLVGLKKRLGYRGELKWRYFAPNNKNDENPMRDWEQDKRNLMRDEVFKIIISIKSLRIISCVSESPTAYDLANVLDQNDLYFHTYKPITERFQYFLQDLTSSSGRTSLGLIVADHRGRGDDEKLRSLHERLVRENRQYTSTYGNFVESLFFAQSHLSIGIQLVDMIAGAIWRAQSYNDTTWYDVLRPAFRSNSGGQIDGFGIARFPKRGWQGTVLN